MYRKNLYFLLFACLILFLPEYLFAKPVELNDHIKIDSLAGIKIGDSHQKVLKTLGKSVKQDKIQINDCDWLMKKNFRHKGLDVEITFAPENGPVEEVRILSGGAQVRLLADVVLNKTTGNGLISIFGDPASLRKEQGEYIYSMIFKQKEGPELFFVFKVPTKDVGPIEDLFIGKKIIEDPTFIKHFGNRKPSGAGIQKPAPEACEI